MANNAQKTFVYVILGFLPLVFPILFTPIYTRYLSIEDYGMLNLFNIISGLLIPFIAMGADQAFGYLYWDHHKDDDSLKNFMAESLVFILLVLGLVNVLGLTLGPFLIPAMFKNGDQFLFWPFIVSAFMFSSSTVMFRIVQYFFRNRESIRNYAVLSVSALVLSALLSLLMVVVLQWGVSGAVLGRTISLALVTSFFIFVFIRKFGLRFNPRHNRSVLVYSLPLLLSSAVGVVAYSIDKIIVEEYTSLFVLGIYGFAVLIAGIIEIFVNALSNSFIPGIYKILLTNEREKYSEAQHSLNLMLLLTNLAVSLLIAITAPAVMLMIPEKFHTALQYTSVLTLASMFKPYTLYFTQNFYKHKKTLFVLYSNLIYLAVISLSSFPLFHFFGLKGIVYSVLLTAVLNMFFVFTFSGRLDRYRLDISRAVWLSTLNFVSIMALEIAGNFTALHWVFNTIPFLINLVYVSIYYREEITEFSPKKLFHSGKKNGTTA